MQLARGFFFVGAFVQRRFCAAANATVYDKRRAAAKEIRGREHGGGRARAREQNCSSAFYRGAYELSWRRVGQADAHPVR